MNKIILSLVMFTAVFGLPLYCILVVAGVHNDPVMDGIIYKSGKQHPKTFTALFFLNMIRKMIFSIMFLPALSSFNSPWYAFSIIIIQLAILALIALTMPYVNNICNYNQFGGNLIQMMAALTILIDKVVDNLNDMPIGTRTKRATAVYTVYREHYLVITFFTQITVYMLSAIAMVWIGKKILRNFYMRALYGTRNELE